MEAQNKLMKKTVPLLALLAWMGVIYLFSDQANSNESTLEIFGSFNYFARKIAHMTEYAILFLLFLWNFKTNLTAIEHSHSWMMPLIALLASAAYAGSDEWHQSFVPGRSALFSDVLIDTAGAGIAMLSYAALKRLGQKRT